MKFSALRALYLTSFLLVRSADWLQGPYFYEVYASKLDSASDVSRLFLVGFVSGMVAGTFMGSLVDNFGRRKGCLLCVACMLLSCASTHADSLLLLTLGRIAGGFGSSLMFSAFEAWVLAELRRTEHEEGAAGALFSTQWFWDGVVAILAGLAAGKLAEWRGVNGPFDGAMVLLLAALALIAVGYSENYGGSGSGKDGDGDGDGAAGRAASVGDALADVRRTPRIAGLAIMQSLFEGSMYSFVMLWVPTIKRAAGKDELPLGYLFALFMLAVMGGSKLSAALVRAGFTHARVMQLLALLSAAALALPATAVGGYLPTLAAFTMFEFTVGMYFPTIATLRSQVLPERTRATLLMLVRIPLNLFVVGVLLSVDLLPTEALFAICVAALLLVAALATALGSAPAKAKDE